jgi:2-succinyl-5-enolpyruvyl-6-hydroxy-3-cyclohexene-1-carboxylate synthase
MPLQTNDINTLWGALLIEELIRNGSHYFCLSPGSRSTPLTLAIARHHQAKTIVCHDERGAAFHALGYARATGKPAVLVCTSGSAAAHYYPAVVEAAMDRLPMLILSADRPPELQNTGANQTIHQSALFGTYAKWHLDLPCPDPAIAPTTLLSAIDQALYQARATPSGPVHVNCPFREPLTPSEEITDDADYLKTLVAWQASQEPFTRYLPSTQQPAYSFIQQVKTLLQTTRNGLIAIGQLHNEAERRSVKRLLAALPWPAFTDVTSGLRLSQSARSVVHYYDQLLLCDAFCATHRPETLLQVGSPFVSKRFLHYIQQTPQPRHHIIVKNHPYRHDPSYTVTHHVETDIVAFCEALLDEHVAISSAPQWTHAFLARSALVDRIVSTTVNASQSLSEIAVAQLVSERLPAEQALWLGNSMPVRDMDMYGSPFGSSEQVAANRGASGIDGTVAAASGFAVGLNKPVTLVLGDLALLHDLNSLGLVMRCPVPLVIIVINNNGGGIFSMLPIADFPDVFETYFATPTHLSFEAAAQLFGLTYAHPKTPGEFLMAYDKGLAASTTTLIEVVTDRQENARLHRRLQQTIIAALKQEFPC